MHNDYRQNHSCIDPKSVARFPAKLNSIKASFQNNSNPFLRGKSSMMPAKKKAHGKKVIKAKRTFLWLLSENHSRSGQGQLVKHIQNVQQLSAPHDKFPKTFLQISGIDWLSAATRAITYYYCNIIGDRVLQRVELCCYGISVSELRCAPTTIEM